MLSKKEAVDMLASPMNRAMIIKKERTEEFFTAMKKTIPTEEFWDECKKTASSLDVERLNDILKNNE